MSKTFDRTAVTVLDTIGSRLNGFRHLQNETDVTTPCLILGLGGSGLETTRQLRPLLRDAYGDYIEILDLDCDENEIKVHGANPDWLDLRVYRAPEILRNLHMFPSWAHHFPKGCEMGPVRVGAGQKPLIGFLTFAVNYPEIKKRIMEALSRLLDIEQPGTKRRDPKNLRVIIVASGAGGAGRGTLIPAAQCVHSCLEELRGRCDANATVDGVVFLASGFLSRLKEVNQQVAKANTYGLLRELGFLDEHPDRWEYRFRRTEPVSRLTSSPFDRLAFIDACTQGGEIVSLDGMRAFLAEILALQLERGAPETQLIGSQVENAHDVECYNKPSIYQSAGGACLRFDAPRVNSYAVQRFLAEKVVDGVLLGGQLPRGTFALDRLVPQVDEVRGRLIETTADDDVLARDQEARDNRYDREFERENEPADLAWEGSQAAEAITKQRAHYGAALARRAKTVTRSVVERVATAFQKACAQAGGAVPEIRSQLERSVRELKGLVARFEPLELGEAEQEHRIALAKLADGPSLVFFKRVRTRRRFRRWFAQLKTLAMTMREAELHRACHAIYAAALACLEEKLGQVASLEDFLSRLKEAAAQATSDTAANSIEESSPILTSAVHPERDSEIYVELLEGRADPEKIVAETLGDLSALLELSSDKDRTAALQPTVAALGARFDAALREHDIYEICERYSEIDIGRWFVEAMQTSPFISIDRARLGEQDEGAITVVCVPDSDKIDEYRVVRDAEKTLHRSQDPHRIVVMKAFTSFPLYALSNIETIRENYVKVLKKAEKNPRNLPTILAPFAKTDYDILPEQADVDAEADTLKGIV